MKQGIIAFLVVLAGCFGIFAVLGLRAPPPEPVSAPAVTVKLSPDPKLRAICGISSGGICAFTAAWERPQSFGKVLSHVGSFTNIRSLPDTPGRGGNDYPARIRRMEPKPIRVFLQDGTQDLDNNNGSWPLANMQMEKALAFKAPLRPDNATCVSAFSCPAAAVNPKASK